jgi:23S rRNA-/tRNA-specific pseudouridylate synthase
MKLYYQKLFKRESGIIDLPLGEIRKIDPIKLWIGKGEKLVKPILKLLGKEGNYSRLEFIPYTGRTHRIRVHSQQGLGIGILQIACIMVSSLTVCTYTLNNYLFVILRPKLKLT